MILVDTSVWIDHLRSGEPVLATALEGGRMLMPPFVFGELACGNLKNRVRCSGSWEICPRHRPQLPLKFWA